MDKTNFLTKALLVRFMDYESGPRYNTARGKHRTAVTKSLDPLGAQTKYEFTTQINKEGKQIYKQM